ncbi:hypothetical protein NN561_010604 [Cricetulus griseus]
MGVPDFSGAETRIFWVSLSWDPSRPSSPAEPHLLRCYGPRPARVHRTPQTSASLCKGLLSRSSRGPGGWGVCCQPRREVVRTRARGAAGAQGRSASGPAGQVGGLCATKLALPPRTRSLSGRLSRLLPAFRPRFFINAQSEIVMEFQSVRCSWNLAGASKGLAASAITLLSATVPHAAESQASVLQTSRRSRSTEEAALAVGA